MRIAFASLLLLAPLAAAEDAKRLAALDPAPLLLVGVHVVPVASEGVLADHCVRIEDGRIVAVAPELAPREGERVVDGGGKLWVIPGLADMHLHFPPDGTGPAARRCLALLLANGVTTARGLAGHPKHLEMREAVESGELQGPAILAAGPAFHVKSVTSAEQADSMVRAQAKAGYDLVKSHHVLDPAIYDAIQAAAKEEGLPVAGHVTNEVGLDRALAADMQVEHLDGFVAALATDLEGVPPFGQFPPPEALDKVDPERIAGIAERFARAGLPNTPTLALFERICDRTATGDELAALPPMQYVSAKTREAWAKERDQQLAAGFPHGDSGERYADLRRRIVRELAEAGAPLLVGSDCPQNFFVEGFAMHDELEALERAGLTPAQALRAATLGAAEYLAGAGSPRIAPDFGAIEAGRRADLVLLRADPLAAIANARAIEAVVVRGKLLDRAALDALLAEAAAIATQ